MNIYHIITGIRITTTCSPLTTEPHICKGFNRGCSRLKRKTEEPLTSRTNMYSRLERNSRVHAPPRLSDTGVEWETDPVTKGRQKARFRLGARARVSQDGALYTP